jgi:heptosyltransferase II
MPFVSESRIVVRVPQWLGDAVVSTVFLRRLRNRFPGAFIAAACRPALAPVFESMPGLNTVVSLPKEEGTFGAGRTLKAQGFDTAYVLPQSARTALEPWLAGIPRRIGFGGDIRRFLFTETRPYRFDLLYPKRYLALLDDRAEDILSTPPFFPSTEPSASRMTELFGGPWEALKKPVLGIVPASIAPARTWPTSRFAEVARRFQASTGGTVLLIGTAKEKPIIDEVRSALTGPVVDTSGRLSLPELGFAISRCDRLLCNDSGLMHVAACFNVPTVIPFGSSDPAVILPPWGKFNGPYHQVIDCQPCRRNHCARFGEVRFACLKAVSVEEVTSALQSSGT